MIKRDDASSKRQSRATTWLKCGTKLVWCAVALIMELLVFCCPVWARGLKDNGVAGVIGS